MRRASAQVTPSALGCEECLKIGSMWVHLRLCRTCGHVGCCDSSPNRHATKHFHATQHPIIEGYDPPEGWGWCYRRRGLFRSLWSHDAAQRPDPAVRLSASMRSRGVGLGVERPRAARVIMVALLFAESASTKPAAARCGRRRHRAIPRAASVLVSTSRFGGRPDASSSLPMRVFCGQKMIAVVAKAHRHQPRGTNLRPRSPEGEP